MLMDLNSLPSLQNTIATFQLSTRKSLGQHFLLDETITNAIATTAGDMHGHHVIEIGPGPGGLTRSLLKAGAKKLYVVEKDDRCIAIMEQLQKVSDNKLMILHADALEIDLLSATPAPRKIVANLPYNAGTAMLLNWLDAVYAHGPDAFSSLTLMFQKEVADRITANHGSKDYGRLSVLCQWLCECRYDFELPPEAFSPPPKVTSAVVTLVPRKLPLVDVKKEHLEVVIAAAFGQRRKMLRQALKGLKIPAEPLLEKAGIAATLRAEQVDILTLCKLAKTYENLTVKGP